MFRDIATDRVKLKKLNCHTFLATPLLCNPGTNHAGDEINRKLSVTMETVSFLWVLLLDLHTHLRTVQ